MRWFKHMTDSSRDERVAELISIAGHEGYGLWWMVLETIAAGMDKDSGKCSLRYPVSRWASELHLLPQNVMRQLRPLADCGLIAITLHPPQQARSEGGSSLAVASQQARKGPAIVELSVPNLLKYRDEYSRKSGHSPDSVRSKIQIQIQNTDTEAETEKSAPVGALDVGLFEVAKPSEDDTISGVAKRICARHPGRHSCGQKEAAKSLKAILGKLPKSERIAKLAKIDRTHEGWCASEAWTKEGGQYAKGLSNWLAPTMGRYEVEPPSRASPYNGATIYKQGDYNAQGEWVEF